LDDVASDTCIDRLVIRCHSTLEPRIQDAWDDEASILMTRLLIEYPSTDRHVMGCNGTQDRRAQHALDDAASIICEALFDGTTSRSCSAQPSSCLPTTSRQGPHPTFQCIFEPCARAAQGEVELVDTAFRLDYPSS